jgi:hypothetical protein
MEVKVWIQQPQIVEILVNWKVFKSKLVSFVCNWLTFTHISLHSRSKLNTKTPPKSWCPERNLSRHLTWCETWMALAIPNPHQFSHRVQNGVLSARSDDTTSLKGLRLDWISSTVSRWTCLLHWHVMLIEGNMIWQCLHPWLCRHAYCRGLINLPITDHLF